MWPANSYYFWFSPCAQNVALHACKIFSVHCDFWAKLHKQSAVTFKSLLFVFISMLTVLPTVNSA